MEFLLFGEFVYLRELPGDTDGPAEAVASDEEGLHAPAPEMAERKDVKMAHDSLPGDDVAVHCILLQAMTQTATLWRSLPTVANRQEYLFFFFYCTPSSQTIISASLLA